MNCIIILLLLACCSNGNNTNNRCNCHKHCECDNGCDCDNSLDGNWGCHNDCSCDNDYNNVAGDCGCREERNERGCERMCERACEEVCEDLNDRNKYTAHSVSRQEFQSFGHQMAYDNMNCDRRDNMNYDKRDNGYDKYDRRRDDRCETCGCEAE